MATGHTDNNLNDDTGDTMMAMTMTTATMTMAMMMMRTTMAMTMTMMTTINTWVVGGSAAIRDV